MCVLCSVCVQNKDSHLKAVENVLRQPTKGLFTCTRHVCGDSPNGGLRATCTCTCICDLSEVVICNILPTEDA